MAIDALDPGPNGDYPYLPRNPDGTLDTVRMPIGLRHQRGRDGKLHLIDVEPTVADGRRVSDIVPAPHSTDPKHRPGCRTAESAALPAPRPLAG